MAYEQVGQSERAQADYRRAIAINSQLSNGYIDRGVKLGEMGNFRQSIASLTEGIRLAPQNINGYFNRGTTYFQLGDLEKAIADFSMVIQLASNDEDAYYWRGISNEAAGHQDAAISDYRQFLKISQNPRAREEIEEKLNQWHQGEQKRAAKRKVVPIDRQKTDQIQSKKQDQDLDLYGPTRRLPFHF